MEALLSVLSLLLIILNIQDISAVEQVCRQSSIAEEIHIDIFTELLSNHTDLLEDFNPAPVVGDMDRNLPAYEFKGSGIHLSDEYLSKTIREYSCSTNEITLLGSVFFKKGDSSGPIVELSYADSFGPTLPVFSMRMDALADEIIIAYRHLGKLHTEVFPARLHNGKWRSYAVTLSGNQALVYDNCVLAHQRVIPLPDYCIDDASVIVSIADTALMEDRNNMMFAFLQNVGIHFGHRGIQQTCPELPEACPSCGRFLKLVQKVYGLNQEVVQLRARVAELEGRDVTCVNRDTECTHTVNGQTTTFSHGSFKSFTDQTVCYCSDGVVECTGSTNVCLNGVVDPGVLANTTGGLDDPGVSPTVASTTTVASSGLLCPASGHIPQLLLGELTSLMASPTDMFCTLYTCVRSRFMGVIRTEMTVSCSGTSECDASLYVTEQDQSVAICCRKCNLCNFKNCSGDTQCVINDLKEASCECASGYEQDESSELCTDINECVETSQCPDEAVCTNTVGSYTCVCNAGFTTVVSSNGSISCEDDDECSALSSNTCIGNTVCLNSPGGYSCVCPEGTILTAPGICESSCAPPCLNGGECISGGACNCHPGYTGMHCERDVNECSDNIMNNCNSEHGVCINTMGGFFCRCRAGFVGNGSHCDDVDECSLDLDNCLDHATCVNVHGSFECLCGANICTGSCSYGSKRSNVILNNAESIIIENCRNCSCFDGDISCVKIQCGDCSTSPPRDCCPECYRQDCEVGSIRIRPGQTWVNPQNRCQRTFCGNDLVATTIDDSENCPVLNCPADLTIQPMSKCCPVCLLHPCTVKNNKQSVSIRNGCETCTCLNSQWSCDKKIDCPAIDCEPENILFSYNGCCPVCASQALQVLNTRLCET